MRSSCKKKHITMSATTVVTLRYPDGGSKEMSIMSQDFKLITDSLQTLKGRMPVGKSLFYFEMPGCILVAFHPKQNKMDVYLLVVSEGDRLKLEDVQNKFHESYGAEILGGRTLSVVHRGQLNNSSDDPEFCTSGAIIVASSPEETSLSSPSEVAASGAIHDTQAQCETEQNTNLCSVLVSSPLDSISEALVPGNEGLKLPPQNDTKDEFCRRELVIQVSPPDQSPQPDQNKFIKAYGDTPLQSKGPRRLLQVEMIPSPPAESDDQRGKCSELQREDNETNTHLISKNIAAVQSTGDDKPACSVSGVSLSQKKSLTRSQSDSKLCDPCTASIPRAKNAKSTENLLEQGGIQESRQSLNRGGSEAVLPLLGKNPPNTHASTTSFIKPESIRSDAPINQPPVQSQSIGEVSANPNQSTSPMVHTNTHPQPCTHDSDLDKGPNFDQLVLNTPKFLQLRDPQPNSDLSSTAHDQNENSDSNPRVDSANQNEAEGNRALVYVYSEPNRVPRDGYSNVLPGEFPRREVYEQEKKDLLEDDLDRVWIIYGTQYLNDRHLMAGKTIPNCYITHVEPIGFGGNGCVCECRINDQLLVIKGTQYRHRELNVFSKQDHPNIMPLLGVLLDSELNSYQVMPKMTCSLADVWKENGTLLDYINVDAWTWNSCILPNALYILREVLNGLDHLHSQNIQHSDIKPSNILIRVRETCECPNVLFCSCPKEQKCEVRIADFDSSKQSESPITVSRWPRYVKTVAKHSDGAKRLLGTRTFRASEVLAIPKHKHPALSRQYEGMTEPECSLEGPHSDIVSFGVTLIQLCIGDARSDEMEARCLVHDFDSKYLAITTEPIVAIFRCFRLSKLALDHDRLVPFAKLASDCLEINYRKRISAKQLLARLDKDFSNS